MARIIVLVAGVDPVEDIGAGHTSYVRAHARAVARAGFEPHIFCAGRSAAIVETDLARETFWEKFSAEAFVEALRTTYAEVGVEPGVFGR